jgi:Protein of unknown function (DUF2975)
VHEALKKSGINFVAYFPDDQIHDAQKLTTEDKDFTTVGVTNEGKWSASLSGRIVKVDIIDQQGIKSPIKKSSTIFLQAVIVLIGIGALALMLWEPHIEGRNAHATVFEIYFKDPFLAYAYLASIPFFVALYQAFKVLGYIGQNKAFSQATVKALRTIKFCALTIIGFVAVGELFIMLGNSDDRAGGVFMGILITFGSVVIATAAAMFERILQNAVDIKSENDLMRKQSRSS